jgi:flagellar hook-basal body protein
MSAYDLNALSGINASSQGLGVISNNLANSQTVGFKSGRAEFADMFSGAQKSPGNGVRVGAITQSFEQGTITATGREMDLALDGEGFFILQDQTGKYGNVYSRNGSFKLDKEGFMTDQTGNKVMGYTLNPDLSSELNPVFNTTLGTINLMELNKTPRATDEMMYEINLDGQEKANLDPFDVNPTATVGSTQNLLKLTKPEAVGVGPFGGFPDFTTQKTIYDTLGGEHRLTSNFYKRDVVEAVVGLASFQDSYNDYSNALVNFKNEMLTIAEEIDADPAAFNYLGPALTQFADPDLGTYDPTLFRDAIDNAANWDLVADPNAQTTIQGQIDPLETALENAFTAFQAKINADALEGLGNGTALTANPADAYTLTVDEAITYSEYQYELDGDNGVTYDGRKVADINEMGEKYSSWIVQYTVEDYDKETGEWVTSGHRYDQVNGVATNEAGMIFELRFDTDGNLLQTRQPADRNDPQGLNLDANNEPTSRGLSTTDWVEVSGRKGKLDWIINTPMTGATDPLGKEDPTTLQLAIDVSFEDMTMYSGSYILHGVTQNGYRIGDLVGLTTGQDGVIEARYSNGRSIPVAQLAVANFNDLNALEKLGGQMYAESFGSGAATIGKAQAGGMGTINAGALEYSNVDTAGELVKMIQTQRTYQASAQVLSTSQQLTQTILNL